RPRCNPGRARRPGRWKAHVDAASRDEVPGRGRARRPTRPGGARADQPRPPPRGDIARDGGDRQGVRVLFCGVRGSTPAPGAEFVRVGGHTSCVALAPDDRPWTLLLDAGTGIRRVTAAVDGAFRGTLLLT